MPSTPFDDLSEVYGAMVDWPARLAREGPWYRALFGRVGAKRVLDVACGPGRHARMFHAWGLEVEAADISPRMIELARQRCGEDDRLRWRVRSFDQPSGRTGHFDVALCVGNSLALAPDEATVRRALAAMLQALRPGGLAVVQLLNLWRLPDGPCNWQVCRKVALSRGEAVVLKGVRRVGSRGWVDLAVMEVGGGLIESESASLLGMEAPWLAGAADVAGASSVEVFGDLKCGGYDRETSGDLVVWMWK